MFKSLAVVGSFLALTLIPSNSFALTEGDREIVALVQAVNTHEIETGKMAVQKGTDKKVVDFGKKMEKEHSKNFKKTEELGQELGLAPAQTSAVSDMKTKAQRELSSLQGKNGRDFDEAYMDAMVSAHTDVLSKLDQEFIPNAQNEKLKKHLQNTRKHIAQHLEKAKEIQSQLETDRD